MNALAEWDKPAETRAGAAAALQLPIDEGGFADELYLAMLNAVLGYLQGQQS